MYDDDILGFSAKVKENTKYPQRFVEHLNNYIVKGLPNEAHGWTTPTKFSMHPGSNKVFAPDPHNVNAFVAMSMLTSIIQVSSVLGALSYYGGSRPVTAGEARLPNELMKKGV